MTRVLVVAALLLAALLFPGRAHALTYAESMAQCQAQMATMKATDQRYGLVRDYACENSRQGAQAVCLYYGEIRPATGTPYGWGCWAFTGSQCPNNGVFNPLTGQCQVACDARSPATGGFTPPNGSVHCSGGCDVAYFYNGDGTSTATPTGGMCSPDKEQATCESMDDYYWHPTLNVCAPKELDDCEPGQAAKEGVCKQKEQCPEGMQTDEAGLCKKKDTQCPAGKVDGPGGSCVDKNNTCGAGKALKKDGTCGKDANGDGKADDEDDDPNNDSEKNEFSGGDDCNTPPACSGDAIMCGQARIQWRIECNTRRAVNVKGGGCNDPPICTGDKCDAMEYSQLIQQWRTACAVEKLKVTGGGTSDGDANKNGVPDVMEGGVTEEGGGEPGVDTVDAGAMWSKVDQQGWLGGGSCPGLPQFQFMGKSYNLGTKPCEQVALLGQLMMLAAMAGAAYIIGRAAAGV